MKELPPFTRNLSDVVMTVNLMLRGRTNAYGEVTLTANAASTTVENAAYTATAIPLLVPMTANAAAEMAAGTVYVSARANGSFTLTHANNAQNDRTFGYVVLGG